ncbi:MAG TPA: ankyrin repeat domain-containing protein [Tepidisphaeraceae bacterium]|jgi:ankyrin repeat protein|nr:ankyrin repeat domain-containing protein [Tepidisphaeraceae bacterium]
MGFRIKSWITPQLLTGAAFAISVGVLAVVYRPRTAPPELAAALQINDTGAIREAIEQGADVNQPDPDGFYPLQSAVSWGNAQAVKMLIDAGANLRQVDRRGIDPLLQATLGRKAEMLKILLDRGAPINNPGRNRDLLSAAVVLDPGLVSILLGAGANPNPSPVNGKKTPLRYAMDSDSTESLQLLLAAGAKPDAKTNDERITSATTNRSANGRMAAAPLRRPIPRMMRWPRRQFPGMNSLAASARAGGAMSGNAPRYLFPAFHPPRREG